MNNNKIKNWLNWIVEEKLVSFFLEMRSAIVAFIVSFPAHVVTLELEFTPSPGI